MYGHVCDIVIIFKSKGSFAQVGGFSLTELGHSMLTRFRYSELYNLAKTI